MNNWLAARICEGYVWPNLDLANAKDRRSPLHPLNVLNECARMFRENDEMDKVARNYCLLLDKADTPQSADWARVQIALAHEQAGQLRDDIAYLRRIESTNDFGWAR